MFNYDKILNKIKSKIKSRNISSNKKNIRLIVTNEVDSLSKKQLNQLAETDNWLFQDSGFRYGNIDKAIKPQLEDSLVVDIDLDPQI